MRAATCSGKLVYYPAPTPWQELGNENLVCWKELGIYVVEAAKQPFIQMSHCYVLRVFSVV